MTSSLRIRCDLLSYGALKSGLFMVGVGVGLIVALYFSRSYGLLDQWDAVQYYPGYQWKIFRQLLTLYSCSVLICGAIGLLIAFVFEYRLRRKRAGQYRIEY